MASKILSVKDIAMELEGREYYSTVAWEYIVEAVENTLKDFGIIPQASDIDDIDKHIREEYI